MVRESQYLYIVKHAIEPLVKVGIAVDPHKRIAEIESDFGEIDRRQSWVLIGPHGHISRVERAIHVTFDRWRRAGAAGQGMGATEWFSDDCFNDLLAHVRKFFEAEDKGYVVAPFSDVITHCAKPPRVIVPPPPRRIRPQKPLLPTDLECADLGARFDAIYLNTVDRFGIYRFTFEESDWLFSRIEGDHPDYEGGIDPWNDALRLHFRIPHRESWISFIASHYTDFERKSQFGAYCVDDFYELSEQNHHPSLARYASNVIQKIDALPKGEAPNELIRIKSDPTLDPWMNAFCSMASNASNIGEQRR